MTITLQRMERLRRSRSINDVLNIGKEIGKDIVRAANINKVLGITPQESLSATLKFNHSKINELPKATKGKVAVKTAPANMGAKLTTFKAPPMAQVMKHSAVIHGLQENLRELEAASAMIRTAFSRQKTQGAALKSINALVKEARTALDDAMNSVSFIAKKHVPADMALLGEELRSFLIDNLKRTQYYDIKTHVYVTAGEDRSSPTDKKLPHKTFKSGTTTVKASKAPTKAELKQDIVFAFYVDIEDLVDSTGAKLAHYYVILTGVIDASHTGIRYFLTALPDFRAPGLYNVGQQVETSEQMIRRMTMLLANNDIASTLEKKPMPINTADVQRKGFNNIEGVADAYVAENSLWVVLEPAKGAALQKLKDKVVGSVFPLLNSAVGNFRRTSIKHNFIDNDDASLVQFSRRDTVITETHARHVREHLDVKGVLNVYAASSCLWVSLDTKKALAPLQDKVVKAVTPLLNEVLDMTPRSASAIKYNDDIVRNGKNIIQFFLTPSAKGHGSTVNAEQLAQLQEQLGLDDSVMDEIHRVLRRSR